MKEYKKLIDSIGEILQKGRERIERSKIRDRVSEIDVESLCLTSMYIWNCLVKPINLNSTIGCTL